MPTVIFPSPRRIHPTDAAYCAGLFEGEGHIAQHQAGKGASIRIGMTDLEPLERFARIMGGHIGGPYSYADPKYKPHWEFRLGTYIDLLRALKFMRPWLSPRRIAQIEQALAEGPPDLRRMRGRGKWYRA